MPIDPYASPAVNVIPASPSSGSAITEGVVRQLAGTKPWVRFMSVLIFVGAGFLVLGALGAVVLIIGGMASAATEGKWAAGGLGAGIGVFYLVLAILYIYPGMKLWKYANRIGHLVRTGSSLDLEAALAEQRKFWKFTGIVMLIFISLYGLVFIGFLVAVGAGAMKASGF
jgi:hypothetical protein